MKTKTLLFSQCLPLLAALGACIYTQAQTQSLSLVMSAAPSDAPAASPGGKTSDGSRDAGRFHAQGDIQILPFTMAREFPLVSANVNGTEGEMLFDTGAQDALNLNDHLLTSLGPGKVIGAGFTGSGEQFTVNLHSRVDRISLGPAESRLNFVGVPDVRSQNLAFLEQWTTPRCIGWIGWGFFDGYLMKLDYAKGILTFYKATEARRASKDFLRGETVLAILSFETRKLPNHPLIHLKIGAHEFLGAFDTGQIGMVQMSEEMQQALTRERLLTPLSAQGKASGPTKRSVTRCRIEGLRLSGSDGDTITASVDAVPVFNQPSPAAVPMGTPEANIISLGYAFLSQYKTVWDYPNKKIYLLQK